MRPMLQVSSSDVVDLLRAGKSWEEVAKALSCSISTAKRVLRESGLKRSNVCLGGQQLDAIIADTGNRFPHWGRRMLQGHLYSEMNLSVSEYRIRRSIKNVQSHLVQQRLHRRLRRRRYHISHALEVLHIDGNDKLVMWKFVLHGAIDGFSRRILYLKCSEDNKSVTVYSHFKLMALTYGLPAKVRSDKGGENILVCESMMHLHGTSTCFITGRSVHNQRIERFWVDANKALRGVKEEFLQLEEEDLLDRNSETDIFSLHVVYKQLIDKRLDEFVRAWNSHRLSTNGKSPDDLFFTSTTEQSSRIRYPIVDDFNAFEEDQSCSYMRLKAIGHQGNSRISVNLPSGVQNCAEDINDILESLKRYEVSEKEAYVAVRALISAIS